MWSWIDFATPPEPTIKVIEALAGGDSERTL
jgi:hypothetical protein